MKLYDAAWAPSPRRVRIYLAEKGLEVPRVALDLRQDEQLAPAFLAVNARGTVPALELDHGEVICESSAICRYFEALNPAPPLFGTTPLEIARVEQWLRRIDGEGYAACVYAFRNSRPAMAGRGAPGKWPEIPLIPELATRGSIMWADFLAALDARLGGNEWVAGEAFSYADIAALTTIDFARSAKLPVPEAHENVARWHRAASARPSAAA